jgi:hypothetical protein
MKKYDGWAIKYSWGAIDSSTFQESRNAVRKRWDSQAHHPSMFWKNASRRYGHKIVKVKLIEVE